MRAEDGVSTQGTSRVDTQGVEKQKTIIDKEEVLRAVDMNIITSCTVSAEVTTKVLLSLFSCKSLF